MSSLLYWLYVGGIGAAFCVGWFRLRRKAAVQPVVWLLGITCCSEALAQLLAVTVRNNLPVYHVYHPVQILLWALFFHRNLRSKWRLTVGPLAGGLLLFAAVNTAFLQPPLQKFPTNLIAAESLVLLFWAFCLFLEYLDRPSPERIFRQSPFIIGVAVLWFNLVSYLFFELYNSYTTSAALLRSVWSVHLFSNYTYYSLLLAAMFLKDSSPAHD